MKRSNTRAQSETAKTSDDNDLILQTLNDDINQVPKTCATVAAAAVAADRRPNLSETCEFSMQILYVYNRFFFSYRACCRQAAAASIRFLKLRSSLL